MIYDINDIGYMINGVSKKRPTLVLIIFLHPKHPQQQFCSFFNCPVRVDFQTVQTCIPKCIMALSTSKIVRMNNHNGNGVIIEVVRHSWLHLHFPSSRPHTYSPPPPMQ